MISPKEAIEKILQRGKLAEVKAVDLDDALGYVLAEDVVSNVNVPPFNNSAMDGFAMHSADLRKTGPLKIIGEVQAGQEAKILVKEGAVISIMTGAALPEKTNAVIPVENVEASESEITVKKAVEKSANIRRAGEDIKKGSTIIKAGMVLKPINIGLAASVGVAELKVYGKPKVVIVVTGDELIKPGQDLKPGQIYESNSFFLKGLLKKLEADVVYSAKAKDTLEDTID
ncbi:MAG TPA: molybdopterin molybdenumtransferase MoeA, partial [Actinobacteria bacterium]|nr:molybdopterin molybdenumtransferase MoeA [Actinomycetota bacterium]